MFTCTSEHVPPTFLKLRWMSAAAASTWYIAVVLFLVGAAYVVWPWLADACPVWLAAAAATVDKWKYGVRLMTLHLPPPTKHHSSVCLSVCPARGGLFARLNVGRPTTGPDACVAGYLCTRRWSFAAIYRGTSWQLNYPSRWRVLLHNLRCFGEFYLCGRSNTNRPYYGSYPSVRLSVLCRKGS